VPLKAAFADSSVLGPYRFKNFGNFDYGGFYTGEAADIKRVPAITYSVYDQVVRDAMTNAQNTLLTNDSITARQLLEMEINEVKAALPDKVIR
jgi:hypothetical protein